MITSALFVGGKLLADRNKNKKKKRSSSSGSSTSSKENNGNNQLLRPNDAELIDQKLSASLCGKRMDANPRRLNLKTALLPDQKETNNCSESKKAFKEFRTQTRDLSDIIALADDSSSHRYFAEQLFDPSRNIRIFTRTFSTFPVDMVKAVFYVPCSPSDFLSLLDLEHRASWDENFSSGNVLHHEGEKNRDDFCIKTMKFDAFPNLVMPRDFELGVHTKLDKVSGNAYVKAISTPYEFGSKVDSSSVVRGYIPMSGFVVKPKHVDQKLCQEIYEHQDEEQRMGITRLMDETKKRKNSSMSSNENASSSNIFSQSSALFGQVKNWSTKRVQKAMSSSSKSNSSNSSSQKQQQLFPSASTTHCEVTYVALVHPRGSIPVLLLNLIIGKQTASMKILQNAALKMSLEKEKKLKSGSNNLSSKL